MQKTTSDNFVFDVITYEKALEEFNQTELFRIHEDGTESLIETMEELQESFTKGIPVGIELGFELI